MTPGRDLDQAPGKAPPAEGSWAEDLPGQPLYALPAALPPLDAVRGTILALDWKALRLAGLHGPYAAVIEPEQREALLESTAGSWVPLALLEVHYRALDALALDEEVIRTVGRSVGEGVHGAFLSTLTRLAGHLGVTPWLALEQSYELWARSWRGGGIAVHRVGDRRARVTLVQTAVCASRFYRASFAGALCAGIAPFGRSPEAVELEASRSPTSVAFHLTWAP